MKVSTITAAGIDIELDGKPYRLSPLTYDDIGAFERWMQERLIEVAQRMGKKLSAEDRQAVLSEVVQRASTIDITSPEAGRLMATTEGACRLVWLSLRRQHSELTLDQVKEMLSDPETLDRAVESVNRIADTPTAPQEGQPEKK